MSQFRVGRDQRSGALLLEKDLACIERRSVKLSVIFKPVGLWRRFLCWFGLDFPGPVLFEFVIDHRAVIHYEKRTRFKTKFVVDAIAILTPGRGHVRIVMNPEDYKNRWDARFFIEPYDN